MVEREVAVACDFYFVFVVCYLLCECGRSKVRIVCVVCFGTAGEETLYKSRCFASGYSKCDWWCGSCVSGLELSEHTFCCYKWWQFPVNTFRKNNHLVRFPAFSESFKASFNNAVFDDKRLAPVIIRIASFCMFSNLLLSWIDRFAYTILAYCINGRIKFV